MARLPDARHIIRLMTCALILVAAVSVRADEVDLKIERSLVLAGVAGQLDMLGSAVLAAIPGDAFPDQKARDQAGVLIRESTGKGQLLPIVSRPMRDDLDPAKIEETLQFYNGKLGRKVGRLAAVALAPDLLRETWEGRSILSTLSQDRRSILERLIAAERIVEFNAQVSRIVIRGMVKGYVDYSSEGGNLMMEIEGRLNGVENEIGQSEKAASEIALASFAHTFRPLRDDELRDFTTFSESDAGKWFRASVQKGLELAAFATAQALGEILSRSEPRSRDRKPGRPKKTTDKETQDGKDLMIGYPSKKK